MQNRYPFKAFSLHSICHSICIHICIFFLIIAFGLLDGIAQVSKNNLIWKSFGEHRVAKLHISKGGQAGFESLPSSRTGIHFSNRLTDRQVAENRIRENGSGLALGDVDGDGWTDIYLCRLDGANALYRNLGDWNFEEITKKAGVGLAEHFSTGAALADLDGDADLDLLVNSIGNGTQIFHNDGFGNFSLDTQSKLIARYGATSLAIADINNDGDLDFYVANYRTTTVRDGEDVPAEIKRIGDAIVITPSDRYEVHKTIHGDLQITERGEPDILYVNRDGVFAPVSWKGGAFVNARGKRLQDAPRLWGLSAFFYDLNGDQHPELYICNDFAFSRDQVYFNQNGKQFRAASPFHFRNMSLSSMAIDAADVDRDGDADLFVVEMLSRSFAHRQRQRANALHLRAMPPPLNDHAFVPEILRNTFFLNRGDGSFAEIAQFSGIEASEWSWATLFMDVDLDGWEDCLITNGNFHDVLDADALKHLEELREDNSIETGLKNLKRFPRLETANLAFRNLGNLRFEDVSAQWGFDTIGVSHGMAHGDLDNDGDLDLVVNHLNQSVGIYRNSTSAPRIAVRLRGAKSNRFGIGAKIKLDNQGDPSLPQTQMMMAGGRYLSSDDSIQSFAAKDLEKARLIVTWRNHRQTIVEPIEPNHLYEIHETQTLPSPPQSQILPLFVSSFPRLPSRHDEMPFSDFDRQPMLSREFHRLGPGLTWFDVNGDEWEDLIIGTGRGGRLTLLINQQNQKGNRFVESTKAPMIQNVPRDLTTLLGWQSNDQRFLLAGASNYEDGRAEGPGVYVYDLKKAKREILIQTEASSIGPMALADIDGDGDLDLFVGGRILPGKYPHPASSRIFKNQNRQWHLDEENTRRLKKIGLISGATFSDLNGDHRPDLILAVEWGPIKVFLNQEGILNESTKSLGLSHYTGWWNGVATGDFNGDGRIDLVASNWGQNTRYESFRTKGLDVYFGDWDETGNTSLIESFFDNHSQKNKAWIDLDRIADVLPEVRRRFPSYRAFSETSTEKLLAPYRASSHRLSVNTLESMLFINEGDHFTATALPMKAQWSPAMGIGVADFDGDGHHDIALSQNFFQVEPTFSRYDSGLGLILLGNGKAAFQTLSAKKSGIRIYGEQRGLAVADFNHDARPDLAIAQSHGPVALFQNVKGKPGVRIQLIGNASNPNAVGTQIRMGSTNRLGPVYEIKAGGGYWSQDSMQCIVSGPAHDRLWIRWHNGKEMHLNIPSEARALKISQQNGIVETQ